MKRKLITMAIVAIATAFLPCAINAQGLGGLLKKGKKALEQVVKETPTASDNSKSSERNTAVASTVLDNGIEVINPMAEMIEVTPIGLYGVSKSENYGDAYLVLKVLMKEPKNKANFGGSINNERMIAVDANGKVYNTGENGSWQYDTPEGIPVQVVIDRPGLMFQDIKKDVEVMPIVKFGILIDAYHKGNLTLKNMPIYWDESPE